MDFQNWWKSSFVGGKFFKFNFTNLPWGQVRSKTKFGPVLFSRFDIYWLQTNRQSDKHSVYYIFRETHAYCLVMGKNLVRFSRTCKNFGFLKGPTKKLWTCKGSNISKLLLKLCKIFILRENRRKTIVLISCIILLSVSKFWHSVSWTEQFFWIFTHYTLYNKLINIIRSES